MERIVYLIGAGFSAPLGIPVMSNFLMKSKDMYFSNPKKFEYFKSVFDTISKVSVVKNYYSADLFNIEEILSILEMQEYLDNGDAEIFKKYISDVIQYYTPLIEKHPKKFKKNWREFFLGTNYLFKTYGYFVSNILNLKISQDEHGDLWYSSIPDPRYKYSIISLNYDLVFENIVRFLQDNYYKKSDIGFKYNLDKEFDYNSIYLAKIHGCVEQGNIIPPTWNKNTNQKLLSTWKLAKKLLEEANHIRILGYSLPISDSYIKFLLKAAILNSSHLKTIDVVTLDPDGAAKQRYCDFIKFNYFQFKNRDINEYLYMNEKLQKGSKKFNEGNEMELCYLEDAHKFFIYEK